MTPLSSRGCWGRNAAAAAAMPDSPTLPDKSWTANNSSRKDHYYRRLKSTSSSSKVLDDDSNRKSTCCHCHFFIWNTLSYFKYHHVQSQLEQFTIEGKGGKKFIRIPPNSILNRWYPQLLSGKLKPDSCWICGYSWQDHLKYWWDCRKKKGGVEEFDRCVSMSSATNVVPYSSDRSEESHGIPAFYKRYVQEVKDSEGITRRSSSTSRKNKENEIRRTTLDGRVSFMVPRFDPPPAEKMSLGSLFLLALARIQSIAKVEELIWLNDVESSRKNNR